MEMTITAPPKRDVERALGCGKYNKRRWLRYE